MTPGNGRRAAGAGPVGDPFQNALVELTEAGELDSTQIAGLVETAVADAYHRTNPDDDAEVRVRVDLSSGALEMRRVNDAGEQEPLTITGELVRQAAQAAKVAVGSRRRDAERERVVREVSTRRGELVDSIVERRDGAVWWLRTEGYQAVLPPEEQIPGERLERNQHLKVVVVDVRRRQRDAVVVLSRSHPSLIRQLLQQEVPELGTGQVVVKGIAREAGRRSKVAVSAPAGGIDPQGACIGPKGVRHRAVVSALGDEQVQIITWSPDPAEFVAASLAPATVLRVDLDEESHTAHVLVPADQLSLAIGRSGENARLCARLCGWRIDIGADGNEPAAAAAD